MTKEDLIKEFDVFDTRSNIDKIKSIFFDYTEGISYLEIKLEDLDIIAKRIEIEVMNIQDDNEFVGLKDLNKKL